MRDLNLHTGDPLSLTIAADARLGPTDYADDQIWDLVMGSGDPPALAIQTTFGLRARSMRIFPRFTEGDNALIDPGEFCSPPVVRKAYPNYIQVHTSPFPEIDVELEYWVPESQAISGRFKLVNRSAAVRHVRLELIALLSPNEGQRMACEKIQAATVLSGYTMDLAPVLFLTGGPEAGSGSFPSLLLVYDLPPRSSRQSIWGLAALRDKESSFNLARKTAARKWDAEKNRIELTNDSDIEIITGDADWNTAFLLSQKQANELFMGPTPSLPFLSFVQSRQPDQGYSLRGDGADYNFLWNGQTPLETYYLASMLSPGASHLPKGLLFNFLSIQQDNGFIDHKPGLAGQRSLALATPILASLAWQIYLSTEDQVFLMNAYPGLLRFFKSWFDAAHDRDQDGIPEWDQPTQFGLDDHPIFSRGYSWSQGVDCSTAERVDLCAFLYREAQALIKIAGLANDQEQIAHLQKTAAALKQTIDAAWAEKSAVYHDRDRDTHASIEGEWLGDQTGNGVILIQREFEQPVRLLFHIITSGEVTRSPQIIIYGAGASGYPRLERLTGAKIRWSLGKGSLTGERIYRSLDRIEIQGLSAEDQLVVYSVSNQLLDINTFLPIWAGVPSKEQVQRMLTTHLFATDRFAGRYGPLSYDRHLYLFDDREYKAVHLPLVHLLGEGLAEYGLMDELADLLTRLMTGVIGNLKRDNTFRLHFDADNGSGVGERNALSGLAPVGLFLKAIGVRLISPFKVVLSGINPFPWSVTVKYRGLTVFRQKEKSTVIFPDGQTVDVEGTAPQIVTLERRK